jgi:hypothetical protein
VVPRFDREGPPGIVQSQMPLGCRGAVLNFRCRLLLRVGVDLPTGLLGLVEREKLVGRYDRLLFEWSGRRSVEHVPTDNPK